VRFEIELIIGNEFLLLALILDLFLGKSALLHQDLFSLLGTDLIINIGHRVKGSLINLLPHLFKALLSQLYFFLLATFQTSLIESFSGVGPDWRFAWLDKSRTY